MKSSIAFARIFYTILSIFFMTTYFVLTSPEQQLTTFNATQGGIFGACFGLFLIAFDTVFRKFTLRSFNLMALGLLFGYVMGQAVSFIFGHMITIANPQIPEATAQLIHTSIFLFTTYLGVTMTARAAEEIVVSLPFIHLTPRADKKKDILLDGSILHDVRIIDLVNSGLLDSHLILPRATINELYAQLDNPEEAIKNRARRALDTLKKIEGAPDLHLRFDDTDYAEGGDPMDALVRLARLLDANILTADINRIQMSVIEGVRIINIHNLANSLKPIMQTGEAIDIKIQRYGKESLQGVGYLEDGTMVVVNGGGYYIGQTIKGQVLSVKHTASGRMIFCNAVEDHANPPTPPVTASLSDAETRGVEV